MRLVGAVRVGEVVAECCESGPMLGRKGTWCVRCHFRMVSAQRLAVRDVRFGVKCGVDLDSPGKRGLDCSEGRRGVLSSAQGLVEDGVDGGCNVPRGGQVWLFGYWLLRLYPSGSLSLVGGEGGGRALALSIWGGLLWYSSTLLGAEAVNLRLGWWVGSRGWRVVVFGSVCEALGVGRGGTVSRMGNRSGRNGMRGR